MPDLSYDAAVEVLRNAPLEYQGILRYQESFLHTRDVAKCIGVTTWQLNKWLKEDPSLIEGAYPTVGGYNCPRTLATVFVARFYQNKGITGLIQKKPSDEVSR